MSSLVMIDTSAWTQALRRAGDPAVRARVERHLAQRSAAWCDIIRLELWAGVRNDNERNSLMLLEASLPRLAITDDVWDVAVGLASRALNAGFTTPATDLLIYACAQRYGCAIEHNDHHFALLATVP